MLDVSRKEKGRAKMLKRRIGRAIERAKESEQAWCKFLMENRKGMERN